MSSSYFWNGNPVTIEHIWVRVKENKDQPLYWYNFEVLTEGEARAWVIFPALEITTQEGNKFIISNHYGTGINKCRKGGYYGQYHAGFRKEDILELIREGTEEYKKYSHIGNRDYHLLKRNIQLSEKAYSDNERNRRVWQSKVYPEEFKRMESLRKSIK